MRSAVTIAELSGSYLGRLLNANNVQRKLVTLPLLSLRGESGKNQRPLVQLQNNCQSHQRLGISYFGCTSVMMDGANHSSLLNAQIELPFDWLDLSERELQF